MASQGKCMDVRGGNCGPEVAGHTSILGSIAGAISDRLQTCSSN